MNVSRTGGAPIDTQDMAAGEAQAATATSQTSLPADWLERFHATSTKRASFTTGETIQVAGPIGVEFGATITYSDTKIGPRGGKPSITIQTEGGIPHSSSPPRAMTRAEMKAVMHGLEKQLGEMPVPGSRADRAIVSEMIDKLAAATGTKRVGRFDEASFDSIKRDGHGGLTAGMTVGIKPPPTNDHSHPPPLGLRGIITVHADSRGNLTSEMHIDHSAPGRRTPMSAADKASLAKSLEKYLAELAKIPPARLNASQALWVKLLEYARR